MLSGNLRGALLMIASMGAFRITDVGMKIALEEVPMGQLIVVRSVTTLLLLVFLCRMMGVLKPLPRAARAATAGVVGAEMLGNIFYISALAMLPLSAAVAILQGQPLLLAAAGAILLHERVGPWRWSAIAVGLAGVMLIIRPGTDAFGPGGLLVIGALFCVVGRDFASRQLPASAPSLLIALITSIGVLCLGLVLGLMEDWQPMTGRVTVALLLAGITITGGYVFSIAAIRSGDVGFVAPFRYSALLWGGGLGYLFFAEVPDGLSLVGAAIVVGAGLVLLWRERRGVA